MEFGSANEAIRRRSYRELVCAAQVVRLGRMTLYQGHGESCA